MGCGRVNYGSENPQIYTTGADIYVYTKDVAIFTQESGIWNKERKHEKQKQKMGEGAENGLYRVGEKEEESEKF